MNPEVKVKWLEALRSGDYAQATQNLGWREPGQASPGPTSYCCLGVLCDISGLGRWELRDPSHHGYWYLDEIGDLPKEVAEWAGLQPVVDTRYLMQLNDSGENDFHQIADYIEENL